MKAVFTKILDILGFMFPSIRIGDFIPVTSSGFWKSRGKPSRSLKKAAKIFDQIGGEIIIEIGTGIHGKMAGNSMLIWSRKTAARRIIAVDPDQKRLCEVEKVTNAHSNVELVAADGIDYLKKLDCKVDLLYLDFWVPDPENSTPGTGRADAYREIYHAAKGIMSVHSIILIDDTDHIHPWKHTYIIPEARKDGYSVLYTGRQTLLKR